MMRGDGRVFAATAKKTAGPLRNPRQQVLPELVYFQDVRKRKKKTRATGRKCRCAESKKSHRDNDRNYDKRV